MFTGLVQDIGVVEKITQTADGGYLALRTRLAARLRQGDSLAVNGVCLTVSTPAGERVEAVFVPETMSRTSLGGLRRGARVNLEPSLAVGEPLGGHIVQGHVDGTGQLAAKKQVGVSWELSLTADRTLLRYVAEKGSIAIDGVSLTVLRVEATGFSVAIVPHTWGTTVLPQRQVGDRVNLEVDILAKYVERLLAGREPSAQELGGRKPGGQQEAAGATSALTERRLRDLGY